MNTNATLRLIDSHLENAIFQQKEQPEKYTYMVEVLKQIREMLFRRKGNLYCIVVREYGLVYRIFKDKKEAFKIAGNLNGMDDGDNEYKVYKLVKIS